jgi:carboxy-cis,cis-muconate cyclase
MSLTRSPADADRSPFPGDNPNFIAALTTAPFAVVLTDYEIPAAGCPSLVASVDAYGSLQTVFANVTYDSTAGVHGTSISPDNKFIYSADDPGNAVWTHSYDPTTGMVAELQRIEAPEASHPRHLATHPNGEWVYVVYEESNKIASYKRDTLTGLLSDTNVTYSLLPPGQYSIVPFQRDQQADRLI